MQYYFLLKYIHIISSTVLFGTGIGTAFFMLCAYRSHNVAAIAHVSKTVVLADWLFTTPAVIIQPLSGILLVQIMGFPWSTRWIALSMTLYLIVVACWLLVVWLQIKMRQMALDALNKQIALPATYYRYFRFWFLLGWPAFVGILMIFYLMIYKSI